MIALCGNCHAKAPIYDQLTQRAWKANPKNMREGIFRGALELSNSELVFKVGGNWYDNTPVLIAYKDLPLVSCEVVENQALISINALDFTDRKVLRIDKNDVEFAIDSL